MRRLVWALAGLLWTVAAAWGAQDPVASMDRVLGRLEGEMEAQRKAFRIPGMAVAVVQDGKILFAKGYGVRRRGGAEPVTPETVFQGGSTTKAFTRAMGIDPKKVMTIFGEHGNIGPASVPIVLSKLREEGRLKKGDRVALLGIGSGLNCSMAEVVW